MTLSKGLTCSQGRLKKVQLAAVFCRKRKAVVLALRGTMSMADIVTDAVAHPEQIDDWLPPTFAKVGSSTALTACSQPPSMPKGAQRSSTMCDSWQGHLTARPGYSLHGVGSLSLKDARKGSGMGLRWLWRYGMQPLMLMYPASAQSAVCCAEHAEGPGHGVRPLRHCGGRLCRPG